MILLKEIKHLLLFDFKMVFSILIHNNCIFLKFFYLLNFKFNFFPFKLSNEPCDIPIDIINNKQNDQKFYIKLTDDKKIQILKKTSEWEKIYFFFCNFIFNKKWYAYIIYNITLIG